MCMIASGARRTACTGLTSCGGSQASRHAAGRRQSSRASPGSTACCWPSTSSPSVSLASSTQCGTRGRAAPASCITTHARRCFTSTPLHLHASRPVHRYAPTPLHPYTIKPLRMNAAAALVWLCGQRYDRHNHDDVVGGRESRRRIVVGPGGCGRTVRARDPRHDVNQINLHSNTSLVTAWGL